MKLLAFRITNFRSIVDSGWTNFSADGVTVLVGQNESGKTSILEALAKAFSLDEELSPDDLRIHTDLPTVSISLALENNELDEQFVSPDKTDLIALNRVLGERSNIIAVTFKWVEQSNSKYICETEISDKDFSKAWVEHELAKQALDVVLGGTNIASVQSTETTVNEPSEVVTVVPASSEPQQLTENLIASVIYEMLPSASLFESNSGLLPQSVDIDEKFKLVGTGSRAARNFLTIAGIDLKQLVESNLRTQSHIISRANELISKDFANFWSQTVGKTEKIKLECQVQVYGNEKPEKIGKPYLVFWMSDGLTKLYPHQRSLGTRWFVSFYLQIKASEKSESRRIFLLDEPGANLHSKAQGDVLKLINQLSKDITIVYSTHSPHMIEYGKLYRVHAVQRNGEADDSPTVTVQAHHLGTASSDTLSPILTAMGVDLSNQQVIRKKNNVLLEEMSGFYYLTAFWQLTKEKQEAHFIAATGVNKVEALANMFRGWGLDFIVAFDDDNQARGVYSTMKRYMYGDSDDLAQKNMFKFPRCPGIEDAFSKNDFITYVIKDADAVVENTNSEFMKNGARSKPVTAYTFLLDVKSGAVTLKNLDPETTERIKAIVAGIVSRLKDRE